MTFGYSDVAYPIHPLDMTEVYDVQEGTVLCRSLFQPNTDPRIRMYPPVAFAL